MHYKKKIDSGKIRRAVALGMIEELNERGINRRRISRESKISYQQIDNWVNDNHSPSVKYLKRIEAVHRRYCPDVLSKK